MSTEKPECSIFLGHLFWWLNGERHREDGPAIEYADGTREWYYKGNRVYVSSLEEFTTEIQLLQIQEVQES